MNLYEKELKRKYNHMAIIPLVELQKLKVEISFLETLLDYNSDKYDSLVEDILNHKPFKIDGREFEVREVARES